MAVTQVVAIHAIITVNVVYVFVLAHAALSLEVIQEVVSTVGLVDSLSCRTASGTSTCAVQLARLVLVILITLSLVLTVVEEVDVKSRWHYPQQSSVARRRQVRLHAHSSLNFAREHPRMVRVAHPVWSSWKGLLDFTTTRLARRR